MDEEIRDSFLNETEDEETSSLDKEIPLLVDEDDLADEDEDDLLDQFGLHRVDEEEEPEL